MLDAKALTPAILLLAAGGCNWISPSDLEERRFQVDDDQDGYSASEDCDDGDPAIHPGGEDTWYDGIDSDCQGDDDFDQDLDGYVPEQYVGQTTLGVPTSGLLPGGDCNDEDAASNPGELDDWYDGLDSDCGGEDDFDQDGDGFVPSEYTGEETTNVPASGSLQGGDCDDDDEDINPDATEVWYDGVDQDCQGDNDYDQDGDGWVPEEFAEGDADCDDEEAATNPGATDTCYDDVDSDCDGYSDYDCDFDGYDDVAFGGEDCLDSDANVNPAAQEILFDSAGVDEDCFGGANVFAVSSLDDFTWDQPHDPRIGQNGTDIYVAVSADQVDFIPPGATTQTTLYESILALGFSASDPSGPLDTVIQFQRNSAYPGWQLASGFEMYVDTTAIYGAFSFRYDSSGSRGLRLAAYQLDPVGRKGSSYVPGSYADFTDVALAVDWSGNLHALGCEASGGQAQHIWATPASLADNDDDGTTLFDLDADQCRLDFYDDSPTGGIVSSSSDGLSTWSFTAPTASGESLEDLTLVGTDASLIAGDLEVPGGLSQRWIVVADTINEQIVFISATGTEYTYDVGGLEAVEAQATPSGQLVVAYTGSAGDIGVLIGTPTSAWDELQLEVDFDCEQPVAHIDDTEGYLFVGCAGTSDFALGVAAL